MAYHGIMAIFLTIGWILMVIDMVDFSDAVGPIIRKTSQYKKWVLKASFAVVSTLLLHVLVESSECI